MNKEQLIILKHLYIFLRKYLTILNDIVKKKNNNIHDMYFKHTCNIRNICNFKHNQSIVALIKITKNLITILSCCVM